jgi:hypothetical protein
MHAIHIPDMLKPTILTTTYSRHAEDINFDRNTFNSCCN